MKVKLFLGVKGLNSVTKVHIIDKQYRKLMEYQYLFNRTSGSQIFQSNSTCSVRKDLVQLIFTQIVRPLYVHQLSMSQINEFPYHIVVIFGKLMNARLCAKLMTFS